MLEDPNGRVKHVELDTNNTGILRLEEFTSVVSKVLTQLNLTVKFTIQKT